MFTQTHAPNSRSGKRIPRPSFSDNLISVTPMPGAVSDLAAMALIQVMPFAHVDEEDASDPNEEEERVQ